MSWAPLDDPQCTPWTSFVGSLVHPVGPLGHLGDPLGPPIVDFPQASRAPLSAHRMAPTDIPPARLTARAADRPKGRLAPDVDIVVQRGQCVCKELRVLGEGGGVCAKQSTVTIDQKSGILNSVPSGDGT